MSDTSEAIIIEKHDLVPTPAEHELVFPVHPVVIEKTGDDLVVIASTPHELVAAQGVTIQRVKEKLADAAEDERQAQAVLDAVVGAGLKVNGSAERGVARARQRVRFLTKTIEALEAGYVIVPNFPGETIAVRVKRNSPQYREGTSNWSSGHAMRNVAGEEPQDLPAGEGRYVDPQPKCGTEIEPVEGKPGQTQHLAYAASFDEEIGLPAEFLKPTVIQRTGKCLARKIFDEVAVVHMPATVSGVRSYSARTPQTAGVGDPMVVGRLYDRSRGTVRSGQAHMLTFLVAWFIDTTEI